MVRSRRCRVRILLGAVAAVGGLTFIAGPAQASAEGANDSLDVPDPAQVLAAPPKVDPDWKPPPLQPGSVAAEEIGSLESRRDREMDYPREAVFAHAEGKVTIGFMVSETGQISDCLIVQSSNDKYLDMGSCALILARGRYKPARDANGNPVSSGVELPVEWKLDWDVPKAPRENLTRIRFVVRDDGSNANCWVDHGPGTQGISHLEMCAGSWPPYVIELIHQIGGPGDVEIVNISGAALSDATMAAQIAERPGWHRLLGFADWHIIGEDGVDRACEAVAFPGPTELADDKCSLLKRPYLPPLAADGKPVRMRVGTNSAYYVKLPEQ